MRRLFIGLLIVAVAAIALMAVGSAGGKQGTTGPKTNKGQGRAAVGALFAQLSGRNEISPTTGKRGAGDLDGRGSFTAITTDDQLCFGITVAGLTPPQAAHIHKGKKKVNGPIVVPLTPHPAQGDPGASSGCVSADPTLLAAIRKHPKNYYANVHTSDFAGGAVRGQLFHAKPGQAR